VSRLRLIFAFGMVIGLFAGIVATSAVDIGVRAQDATPTTSPNQTTSQTSAGTMSAVDVVDQVAPAVVTVINEQTASDVFGGSQGVQPAGSGTGFIIDDQGHIVTNWHVVTGGEKFEVVFSDGEQREATLVGSDELSDLAVVKVEGDLPGTVSLGDSSTLKPGQPVLAIGSPLGAFTNTVTQGIVSATNRDFPSDQSGGASTYNNLIQHDAAINPGNSGGPLFNMSGEVVGVNTLGIPSENGQPVQGLFFAIPSNTVARIAQTLISEGSVTYPFFGVVFQDLNPQISAQAGLSADYGAYVQEVSNGGPAATAGIKAEDIIISIAGQNIDAQNTFSEVLFSHKPGETVDVVILRGDQQQTVKVTLGTRPGDANQ